jgi:cell division protein FtsB
MAVMNELSRRARQALPPIIGACVFGYFMYHAIQGDRGVLAWLRMSKQLEESRTTLAALTAERESVERRVALLSPESLDPDLLEERARVMLNVAHPDDRLVILKDPVPPSAPHSNHGLGAPD